MAFLDGRPRDAATTLVAAVATAAVCATGAFLAFVEERSVTTAALFGLVVLVGLATALAVGLGAWEALVVGCERSTVPRRAAVAGAVTAWLSVGLVGAGLALVAATATATTGEPLSASVPVFVAVAFAGSLATTTVFLGPVAVPAGAVAGDVLGRWQAEDPVSVREFGR